MQTKWPPFEAGVCHAYRGKSKEIQTFFSLKVLLKCIQSPVNVCDFGIKLFQKGNHALQAQVWDDGRHHFRNEGSDTWKRASSAVGDTYQLIPSIGIQSVLVEIAHHSVIDCDKR